MRNSLCVIGYGTLEYDGWSQWSDDSREGVRVGYICYIGSIRYIGQECVLLRFSGCLLVYLFTCLFLY